jgi:hypothetical protein
MTEPPDPIAWRRTFPDATGADDFVRVYRNTVVPSRRDALGRAVPVIVLHTGGRPGRTVRVLSALQSALDDNGKLVHNVKLEADSDSVLLSRTAGDGLAYDRPGRSMPDRFPDFGLIKAVVECVEEHARDSEVVREVDLRDRAYRHRCERGGVLGLLWGLGGNEAPAASGPLGLALNTFWLPLTRYLPRWYWARRKRRRLVTSKRHGWLGAMLSASGGNANAFELLAQETNQQLTRLRLPEDHPQHEEALEVLERLLLRALLEDLRTPRQGGVLPRRRRRVARPVLLVALPPHGTAGARAGERFLRVFQSLREGAGGGTGPLVIAAGEISAELRTDLGLREERTLQQAAEALGGGSAAPVFVPLPDEPFERIGQHVVPVTPKRFRLGWRTEAVTEFIAVAAVLAVLFAPGGVVGLPGVGDSRSCAGGAARDPGTGARPEVLPKKWYEDVRRRIDEQNAEADQLAAAGHTVRTVVHFGSTKSDTPGDTLFDGVIPELRGIAMWQETLNRDAGADPARVVLRVDVREAGPAFRDARKMAARLVTEIKAGPSGKLDKDKVIGVLGFAQSTRDTRAALATLDKANIAIVGTTATANEMQQASGNYWPTTPDNVREAGIEARFVRDARIIADQGAADRCSKAARAIVVQNDGDLYSNGLSKAFQQDAKDLGLPFQVINYSQTSGASGAGQVSTARGLADEVCRELQLDPRSVVYWTTRARDFTAFVNSLNDSTLCAEDGVTVLGGNELTNVVLTGQYAKKSWLRLYYSAHRVPSTDPRASRKTKEFVEENNEFVAGLNDPGRDPAASARPDIWLEDGHAAVAYDAFHVLSMLADQARSADTGDVDAGTMLALLRSGIRFDGATGYINYPSIDNTPPENKTLVIVRQLADEPKAVAVCGAYSQDAVPAEQGSPCNGVTPPRH